MNKHSGLFICGKLTIPFKSNELDLQCIITDKTSKQKDQANKWQKDMYNKILFLRSLDIDNTYITMYVDMIMSNMIILDKI